MKFGGSSVADAARIRAVVDIVADAAASDRVLLVFSAMKGITDQLLSVADEAATGSGAIGKRCDEIKNRHQEVIRELIPDGASTTAAVDALCRFSAWIDRSGCFFWILGIQEHRDSQGS